MKFNQSNILVCGDIIVDKYLRGTTTRISPEAPVPVVNINDDYTRPGGASNVALNIADLSGQVTLSGILGDDSVATELSDILTAANVRLNALRMPEITTSTKYRIVSQNQQLIRLDRETKLNKKHATACAAHAIEQLPSARALIISDYLKGAMQHCQDIIQAANSYHIPIIVDPKGNCFKKYTGATVVTPNMNELKAITGDLNTEQEIEIACVRLCRQFSFDYLLLTRSEKGMSLFNRDKKLHDIAAVKQDVYDVTGAGDTVVATITLALVSGWDIYDACRIANTAAGIVVGKFGTSTLTISELRAELGIKDDIAC